MPADADREFFLSSIRAVLTKRKCRVYFAAFLTGLTLLLLRAVVLPSAQKIAKNTDAMLRFGACAAPTIGIGLARSTRRLAAGRAMRWLTEEVHKMKRTGLGVALALGVALMAGPALAQQKLVVSIWGGSWKDMVAD